MLLKGYFGYIAVSLIIRKRMHFMFGYKMLT